MIHRFTAACAVASVVIAAGAIISLLPPRWAAADARVITTAWCFVPLAWGLWAMLAPARWVPSRLPIWGAILGVIAGITAGPVLDLPLRLGGLSGIRWMPVIVTCSPSLVHGLWDSSSVKGGLEGLRGQVS
jgi:hypothetical protein